MMSLRCVLVAFFLLVPVGLASPTPALAQSSPALAAKAAAADALIARAASAGAVRVIVRFDSPLDIANLTAGTASLERVESTVREIREGILERLDAAAGAPARRSVRGYRTLAMLALDVSVEELNRLARDPRVVDIVEDSVDRPTLNESVPLIDADDVHTAGFNGTGWSVAVLDTGVDNGHPFFGSRIVEQACFSSNSPSNGSTTVCPNGLETQIGAGAGTNCDLSIAGCDHGTHVAGIAVGSNPTPSAGEPTIGVAPGAGLIAVQVFSRFDNPTLCGSSNPCALSFRSDQIAALEHIFTTVRATRKVASINMSLGGGRNFDPCPSDPRASVIANLRGVRIATVIASGNSFFVDSVGAPACIAEAITVGSSTKTDGISSFSNMDDQVDVMAPGSSILSSVPPSAFGIKSGTSMATPHVAGAWALLKQAAPGATVDEIETALESTGVAITDTRSGGTETKPRIDLDAALAALGTGSTLNSAVLPYARAVTVGTQASAFGVVINSGTTTGTGCSVGLPGSIPGSFTYQTTDFTTNSLTGTPNTPVDIAAGATQGFVFGVTPSAPFDETEIQMIFDCTNRPAATSTNGLNTFFLTAESAAPADMLSIGVTPSGDGIANIPGTTGTGFFTVASRNIGATDTIGASVDDGGRSLPIVLTLCETDPTSGACKAPPSAGPLTRSVAAGELVTYTAFITGTADVPFDPTNNRLFFRFRNPGANTVGATNVAVRTQ